MFGLAIKLYSMLLPFIKEILLGNKRIKKQERNINIFLIGACFFMFLMLFVSNLTNSKLITKVKDLDSKIAMMKEENRTLGMANDKLTTRVNQQDITLNEYSAKENKLYEKIEELENIECNANQSSLSSKFRNIENGMCELDTLNLKADMPPLPRLSRTVDNDKLTGEIMIKYIADLREYIRTSDDFIEKQKSNCK